MGNASETGGKPETLGKCTECGTIYPIRSNENDDVRPVGTDGTCSCGNDEFEVLSER